MSYVECGVISAPRAQARRARLLTIGRGCASCRGAEPDAVAMEEAFFGKNVQSTIALGEARGVALFVAAECGLPLAGYPPAR
jgi:crossover junction endodeoxyribonuclease RuvC